MDFIFKIVCIALLFTINIVMTFLLFLLFESLSLRSLCVKRAID